MVMINTFLKFTIKFLGIDKNNTVNSSENLNLESVSENS